MRRLGVALAAAAAIAWLGVPSSASAQPGSALVPNGSPGYLQDGNGVGDAATPVPGSNANTKNSVFSWGVSLGAFRWDYIILGKVPAGTFTYEPLADATVNDDEVVLLLTASSLGNGYCLGNEAGGAYSDYCGVYTLATANQKWVYDSSTGYFINVGRSNDKQNWEILCNPTSNTQLTITTRDNCSDYHKEWGFNYSS